MCYEEQHICACGAMLDEKSTRACNGSKRRETLLPYMELGESASLEEWGEGESLEEHTVQIDRTYEQRCICGASKPKVHATADERRVVPPVARRLTMADYKFSPYSRPLAYTSSGSSKPPVASYAPPRINPPSLVEAATGANIGPPVHKVTRPGETFVLFAACGCQVGRQTYEKQPNAKFTADVVVNGAGPASVKARESRSYAVRGPKCFKCAAKLEEKAREELKLDGVVLGLEAMKVVYGGDAEDLMGVLANMGIDPDE